MAFEDSGCMAETTKEGNDFAASFNESVPLWGDGWGGFND